MAARPTWKGYLKISLVNIPVRVFPATDAAATISFNQLHRECRTRIQQKRWCPTCQVEVPNSDLVKGYEFEKGQYVVLDEEDIAKVRPASTRVINVVQFADASAIDPVYVERPYYLAPDGQVAAEAFAVMREGMAGKAAIGKLALYGREYLVAIQPRENGPRDVHDAARERSARDVGDRRAADRAGKDQAGRSEARASGDRQFRDRRRSHAVPRRLPGRASQDHRRQDRGRRDRRRRRRKRRRRSSTSWTRCVRASSACPRPRSARRASKQAKPARDVKAPAKKRARG